MENDTSARNVSHRIQSQSGGRHYRMMSTGDAVIGEVLLGVSVLWRGRGRGAAECSFRVGGWTRRAERRGFGQLNLKDMKMVDTQ